MKNYPKIEQLQEGEFKISCKLGSLPRFAEMLPTAGDTPIGAILGQTTMSGSAKGGLASSIKVMLRECEASGKVQAELNVVVQVAALIDNL